MKRTTSNDVITVMKDVFSRHGIPTELITDNGSQYKSFRFKKFTKEWDFQHDTSSPQYHQSNGLAEASVKTSKWRSASKPTKTLNKVCYQSETLHWLVDTAQRNY